MKKSNTRIKLSASDKTMLMGLAVGMGGSFSSEPYIDAYKKMVREIEGAGSIPDKPAHEQPSKGPIINNRGAFSSQGHYINHPDSPERVIFSVDAPCEITIYNEPLSFTVRKTG